MDYERQIMVIKLTINRRPGKMRKLKQMRHLEPQFEKLIIASGFLSLSFERMNSPSIDDSSHSSQRLAMKELSHSLWLAGIRKLSLEQRLLVAGPGMRQ